MFLLIFLLNFCLSTVETDLVLQTERLTIKIFKSAVIKNFIKKDFCYYNRKFFVRTVEELIKEQVEHMLSTKSFLNDHIIYHELNLCDDEIFTVNNTSFNAKNFHFHLLFYNNHEFTLYDLEFVSITETVILFTAKLGV